MTFDKLLDKYVREFSSQESDVLKEIDRVTHQRVLQPRMVSGHIQGQLLTMFTAMKSPKKVLEIGTFTGYSAVCMAKALGDGAVIDTIDINDELSYISNEFFEKSGYSSIIRPHIGSALDVVPSLGQKYDFVFMDGDKREYPDYYNMLMDGGYLLPGAFILADNVLWDGKVVEEMTAKNQKDRYLQGILNFNAMVRNDDRVEVVIMPIRDGMSIIRVK